MRKQDRQVGNVLFIPQKGGIYFLHRLSIHLDFISPSVWIPPSVRSHFHVKTVFKTSSWINMERNIWGQDYFSGQVGFLQTHYLFRPYWKNNLWLGNCITYTGSACVWGLFITWICNLCEVLIRSSFFLENNHSGIIQSHTQPLKSVPHIKTQIVLD